MPGLVLTLNFSDLAIFDYHKTIARRLASSRDQQVCEDTRRPKIDLVHPTYESECFTNPRRYCTRQRD